MNSKGRRAISIAKMSLRKQGPWLILRLYHPDGCRFSDLFIGGTPSEHEKGGRHSGLAREDPLDDEEVGGELC
ncbi:MAG: hypothetical protein H5T64_10525 [Chloroflexi bacterium]|nr:hypothetical protein [Chloroflexota bacterium]